MTINEAIKELKANKKEKFDAIVAGIGYHQGCAEIIEVEKNRFDDLKVSMAKQKYFGKDGLYFCGFWISPTGQFREIGMDAKRIAKDISIKEKSCQPEQREILDCANQKGNR